MTQYSRNNNSNTVPLYLIGRCSFVDLDPMPTFSCEGTKINALSQWYRQRFVDVFLVDGYVQQTERGTARVYDFIWGSFKEF